MPLNTALEGKVYPVSEYRVTAEAIEKYAAATNEVNPAYAGDAAVGPPAFPIAVAGESIRSVLFDPELDVNIARLVQSEETHSFNRPIKAGDVLSVESRVEAIGSQGVSESFEIVTDLKDPGGEVVAYLVSKMFIRGRGPAPVASKAEDQQAPDYLFETKETIDDDQPARYAQASGDHNKIHTDRDFARSSGFPGVVVHGMCTMAFAARAVLEGCGGGDPKRLQTIKVQFSRPVFPGQELTTRGWLEYWLKTDDEGLKACGFETLNPRGQLVLSEGLAEIAD